MLQRWSCVIYAPNMVIYCAVPHTNRNSARAENEQVSLSTMIKHGAREKNVRGTRDTRRERRAESWSLAIKISLNMTYYRCGVSRILFLLRCNVFTVLGEHSSACYRFPFLLLPSLRPPPLKPHEHYVACVCVTRQNSPRERAARSKVDSRILATQPP